MTGRLAPPAVALVLTLALALGFGSVRATAQDNAGVIVGAVISGSSGVTIEDGLTVTLLALDGEASVSAFGETALERGRYRFEVPADGRLTFIPLITYQGMRYLEDPVILSPEEPTATRDFTLFETTRERPALTISSTSATVVAIDRGTGELAIIRDDVVDNPSDRIYVGPGGEESVADVTLTIPVLDGTLEASGEDAGGGEYRHDGEVMLAAVPLWPGPTLLRTRYLVRYDLVEDGYRVRLTAPIEAAEMELRVPPRFLRNLRALEGASRAEDVVLTGDLEGERLLVVTRDAPAAPGEALLAELVGLSGERAVLPLTERRGAILATIVALAILGGATVLAIRRDPTPLDDGDEADVAT